MKCGCETGECFHDYVITEPNKVESLEEQKREAARKALIKRMWPLAPFGPGPDPRKFSRGKEWEAEQRNKKKE